MPVIEAFGTRVERIKGERVKNSIAPERSWLSMSVSPPSWLFGKTWMSTLPPLSLRIASMASTVRIVSGCVTGELLAYFRLKSAAPTRVTRNMAGAATAKPAVTFRTLRRETKLIWRVLLPVLGERDAASRGFPGDGKPAAEERVSHPAPDG